MGLVQSVERLENRSRFFEEEGILFSDMNRGEMNCVPAVLWGVQLVSYLQNLDFSAPTVM